MSLEVHDAPHWTYLICVGGGRWVVQAGSTNSEWPRDSSPPKWFTIPDLIPFKYISQTQAHICFKFAPLLFITSSITYSLVYTLDGPSFLSFSPQFIIPFAFQSTTLLCYNHNARVLKMLNKSSWVSSWYLSQWFLMRNTEYSPPRNTKLSYKSML